MFDKLRKFKGISQLKKAALNIIVRSKITNPTSDANLIEVKQKEALNEEIDNLRRQFIAMDKDQSGMITLEELKQAFNQMNFDLDLAEVKHIVSEMDYYGNGKINYSEFLAATLSASDTMTDEMLWQVFKTFDIDNTDFISQANLLEAFKRLGRDFLVGEDEVRELIKIHDIAHDGKISFDEFKSMFTDKKKTAPAEFDFEENDESVIEIKDTRHLGRYKQRAHVVAQPSTLP